MKIVEKLLRAGEGRILKKLDNIAAQVNAIEEDFEKLTDAELRAETDVFKKRLADGTYGISIVSGEPISDRRLERLPAAERTAEEQRKFERGQL